MFGLILFIFVVSFVVRLFARPFFGYYRPRIYPFGGWGGFGGWGMRYPHHHHHHHHCGPHHHMGHGPMGHGRMW